ncbi:protein SCO1/2 [Paraburkholderia sp. GAS42]
MQLSVTCDILPRSPRQAWRAGTSSDKLRYSRSHRAVSGFKPFHRNLQQRLPSRLPSRLSCLIESSRLHLFPPAPSSCKTQRNSSLDAATGLRRKRIASRGLRALLTVITTGVFAATALTACSHDDAPWQLTNVTGHLPDLQFALTGDDGKPATGDTFKGRTSLVYFGYTHCPDVCPETMGRLMQVVDTLGPDAQHVRILFITVDPARDSAQALHDYIGAFDSKHAFGLTGSDGQIEALAKRYRVAYQMEKRDPKGNYEVTHSSAVYVFDADGHARLLATDHDSPDVIAHDLRRIIDAHS